MQNDLKRILEQLARRQKDTTDIRVLDEELLNPGKEHSDMFDPFLEKQELSLSETMASLMTAETDNGRLLIEGYKENYLNEIIQNINDLDIAVQDEEDTSVDISVKKSDGNYILSCTYRDNGFRARDVYGFCNTGKGAKTEEQDGKFGIGIKALLAATSYFEVRSNIIIRYPDDDGSASIAENVDWDHRHTHARYVIPVPDASGEVNGIHVGKLENIINPVHPEVVFGDTDYEKLVFDFRSLLFMKRINKIVINDWILSCIEECGEEDESEDNPEEKAVDSIKIVSISRNGSEGDHLRERYLCHTPGKKYLGKRDLAFLIDPVNRAVPNRIYSVYYIKSLSDVLHPLGILFNTEHVNPFRNDIANTEDDINRIKAEIKDVLALTLYKWTGYLFDEAEISKAVSISFFRALLSYWDEIADGSHYGDTVANRTNTDFGIFSYVIANRCTVEIMMKIPVNNDYFQRCVVDKVDPEEYETYIPGIENENIVEETKNIYFDTFEKDEVITYLQVLEHGISSEIIEAYKRVSDSDSEELVHLLGWFGNVKEYIKYVILDGNRNADDVSVEEVAEFIRNFKKEHNDRETAILHRILGRYKIIGLFSETGRVRTEKVNFVDYLFADNAEDELLGEIFKVYDEKFGKIKKRLKGDMCSINYAVPYGPSLRRWDGECATRIISVSKSDEFIAKSDAGLLLDVIDKQNLYGYIRNITQEGYYPRYFILNKPSQRRFKIQWDGYRNQNRCVLKGINFIKVLQHCSLGIDEFIKYQHVIDRISGIWIAGTDKYLTGSLQVRVREGRIHVNKLADLILWMTKWIVVGGRCNQNAIQQAVVIDSVDTSDSYNECGADYIDFVNSITGGVIKDIYLRKLDTDNHGAKTVAYIGAGKELHVRLKKSEDFRFLYRFKINNDDSRLYVFFDNQTKEQALAEVIDNLNLGPDITEQIKGYISVAEIGHSVSSYEYERRLQSNPEDDDKIVIPDGMEISKQNAELSVREKKKLFMARGSYNGCCPVCGKSLIGEDNDLDKAVNSSFLYTIKLDDGSFFQSCCCSGCLAILRKTYMGAKLSGNLLKIRQTIVSGEKETSDNDIQIQLSNINIALKGIDT